MTLWQTCTLASDLEKGERCSIAGFRGSKFEYTGKHYLPQGCCNHILVFKDVETGEERHIPNGYIVFRSEKQGANV